MADNPKVKAKVSAGTAGKAAPKTGAAELKDADLQKISGGLNPQPLPPNKIPKT